MADEEFQSEHIGDIRIEVDQKKVGDSYLKGVATISSLKIKWQKSHSQEIWQKLIDQLSRDISELLDYDNS